MVVIHAIGRGAIQAFSGEYLRLWFCLDGS